eukprot:GHUV01029571.1.p1 GENE.GHUV01029571.1~~GHUV01029571.1.p1  ORF type:complete len:230 (+),score=49.47 GHUV01029571.1:441-1130(+)
MSAPQELVHWQTRFKDFYSKHYSTYRQLVWQHSLSTAMLRANFSKGTKELSVSLMQALVLLLFNDADELTFAEIKDQLGVKDERELQRTMLSLSVGKVRVLTKNRKGPEVSPSDVFAYNSAFSNPLFRIKINNIQLKETQEENTKTNEQVRWQKHPTVAEAATLHGCETGFWNGIIAKGLGLHVGVGEMGCRYCCTVSQEAAPCTYHQDMLHCNSKVARSVWKLLSNTI